MLNLNFLIYVDIDILCCSCSSYCMSERLFVSFAVLCSVLVALEVNWYIHEFVFFTALRWRHNGRDGVSNHQPHDCLLNRLFRRRSKKTSKLRVTGLWAGNSPGTGEFPAQMARNAENVSIWWRHHGDRHGCFFDTGAFRKIPSCHWIKSWKTAV